MPEEKKKWVCKCGYKNDLSLVKCFFCNENRPENPKLVFTRNKPLTNWKISQSEKSTDDTNTLLKGKDANPNNLIDNGFVMDTHENKMDYATSENRKTFNTVERRNWFGVYTKEFLPGNDNQWSFLKPNFSEESVDNSSQYFDGDLNNVIEIIKNSTEDEVDEVTQIYCSKASSEDIQILNQCYKDLEDKELFRKIATLTCLALAQKKSLEEGSSNIDGLQTLLEIQKPPEIIATVCQGLAIVGHPKAIPYLTRIITNGPPTNIYEILDPDDYDAYEMNCRYLAMKALPLINHKDAIKALIQTVEMNDSSFDMIDYEIGRGFMGLLSIGATYVDSVQEQKYTSTLLVDPIQLDFDSAVLYKGNVARFWFLQERIDFLKLMSFHEDYGKQAVENCFDFAKTIRQKLVLALVLLGSLNIPIDDILTEGARSKNIVDRILAYDGLTKLASVTNQIDYVRLIHEGLNDSNAVIRLAVAGSVLLNKVEPLLPEVMNMIDNSKLIERKALIRPLLTLSILDETWAFDKLKSLYQREQNQGFRENLSKIIEEIPKIQSKIHEKINDDSDQNQITEVDESRPKWSFLQK